MRTLIAGSCLVLLAVLVLQRLFPGVIGLFELNTVDHRFKLRQALGMAPSYSNRLVHINIDDFAKRQSGESFWLKTVYADLIDQIALGGAVVIATEASERQPLDQPQPGRRLKHVLPYAIHKSLPWSK